MSLEVIIPTIKAEEEEEEEELVDPQQKLRGTCSEQKACVALQEKFQACNDRVNSRSRTTEICAEELLDYLHCVDACVTKDLFSLLK